MKPGFSDENRWKTRISPTLPTFQSSNLTSKQHDFASVLITSNFYYEIYDRTRPDTPLSSKPPILLSHDATAPSSPMD